MKTVFVISESTNKVIGTIPVDDDEVVVVMKGTNETHSGRYTTFFDFVIKEVSVFGGDAVACAIIIPSNLLGFKLEDLTICG
jgi:hypothetical protein